MIITEDALECSECLWCGYEWHASKKDFPDEKDGFACPECGAPCAHFPMDELGCEVSF